MDPASAIGVAAASLQFLEVGIKVAKSTKEILSSASGLTQQQERLSEIASRLADLTSRQSDSLEKDRDEHGETDADRRLREICAECHDKAAAMLSAVGGLVTASEEKRTSFRGAFGEALRSLLNEGNTKRLVQELESSRVQLHTALMVSLWERSILSSRAVSEMQQHVASVLSEIQKAHEPRESLGNTDISMPEVRATTEDVSFNRVIREAVSRIWSREWAPNTAKSGSTTNAEEADDGSRKSTTETATESLERLRAATDVADSLLFEDFKRREEMIPETYKSTLQWIWQTEPPVDDGERLWASFPDWLRDPESTMYWVTGKPGSGKSTLMKYIQHHPSLTHHLSEWAAPTASRPVDVTSFYAWYPGSDMQRSKDGLGRTILERALRQDPGLVSQIVPRRWAFRKCFPNTVPPVDWSPWELQESLTLLFQSCGEGRRMLLLIDGLDEFSAPPKELVAHIKAISIIGRGAVKICAASRPWPAFHDFFASSPQLAMHRLSADDIRLFVKDKLSACVAFHERGPQATRLQSAVLERAGGVFLWVAVVTDFLVVSLEDGNTMDELEGVIRTLPGEMSELYDRIWSRVPESTKAQTARIFLLKEACLRQKMHYMTLWIVDERPTKETIHASDLGGIKKTIVRRLHSRTYGLLEVLPDGSVDFLHRTAFEWTRERELQLEAGAAALELHLDHILMTGFGRLGVRSPVSDWKFISTGDGWEWHEYVMVNFMYHAVKAAASQQTLRTGTESDELTRCVCDFFSVAETWQKAARAVSADVRWRRWLDSGRDGACLYKMAATLGITVLFERLGEPEWDLLHRSTNSPLGWAIYLPRQEMLEDWDMAEKTYLNSELLRPAEKLRLVRIFLERGFAQHSTDLGDDMVQSDMVRRVSAGLADKRAVAAAAYLNEAADLIAFFEQPSTKSEARKPKTKLTERLKGKLRWARSDRPSRP